MPQYRKVQFALSDAELTLKAGNIQAAAGEIDRCELCGCPITITPVHKKFYKESGQKLACWGCCTLVKTIEHLPYWQRAQQDADVHAKRIKSLVTGDGYVPPQGGGGPPWM